MTNLKSRIERNLVLPGLAVAALALWPVTSLVAQQPDPSERDDRAAEVKRDGYKDQAAEKARKGEMPAQASDRAKANWDAKADRTAQAGKSQMDPHSRADNSWITLSGKVKSVNQDNFVLDYGKGTIQVDIKDADRDAKAYKLSSGDKVTVSGRIDDDFFDRSSIDAHSVYIDSQNTTFFADQPRTGMGMQTGRTSDSIYYGGALDMREDYQYNLVGTVAKIEGDEFILDTGSRQVRVELDELDYNPLKEEGHRKINVGDRVSVSGEIDDDIFEGREVVATSVRKLRFSDDS